MFAVLITAVQCDHNNDHEQGKCADQQGDGFGGGKSQGDGGVKVPGGTVGTNDTRPRREAPPKRRPGPSPACRCGHDAASRLSAGHGSHHLSRSTSFLDEPLAASKAGN